MSKKKSKDEHTDRKIREYQNPNSGSTINKCVICRRRIKPIRPWDQGGCEICTNCIQGVRARYQWARAKKRNQLRTLARDSVDRTDYHKEAHRVQGLDDLFSALKSKRIY